MKFNRMKFIYIGIFIIPLLKFITPSPVYPWPKQLDGDKEAPINGQKPKPSIPPWAKENGRGKCNSCFFTIMFDLQ